MPRGRLGTLLVLATLTLGACATSTATPSFESAEAPTPTPAESSPPAGVDLSSVPMACVNLGMDDCRRIVGTLVMVVPAGTAPTYIQVGPFGCVEGGGCARSLAERPQGDVTLEAGAGALSYHVTVAEDGGDMTIDRQDAFGVLVGPSSQPPVAAGARPFRLGHCGLWSGIDAGGTWWDPVGLVDGDHPDAINAAEGMLAIVDPDHATFTSRGGLAVQLQRHQGDKYLPLCQ